MTQSNAVIEYLDRVGGAPPVIPADADAALTSRMLADVFDSYVAGPMQQIVGEALRPKSMRIGCTRFQMVRSTPIALAC